MKKMYVFWLMFLMPMLTFADAKVTDAEMLTVLKAIGCILLFPLLGAIIIGLICSGIRTIRGLFNI